MKANELRIGNYIQDIKGNTTKVWMLSQGSSGSVNGFDEAQEHYPYEPIPLTEEWLIKFGFEYEEDSELWVNRDFAIKLQPHSHLVYKYLAPYKAPAKFYFILGTNVEYVHELQNTWSVLMTSTEELTIKELS